MVPGEAQNIATEVCQHAAGAQTSTQLARTGRANREKTRTTILGHRFDVRDCRIDVECVEGPFQQTDLMAADRAQPVRRQSLFDVEGQHSGRSIV